MDERQTEWMTYIDREVRATCAAKGWGSQIRRKGAVRDKPLSDSALSDYEWKSIPGARGQLPEAAPNDHEGTYYVLSFDSSGPKFVLQHDTVHCGLAGPHWSRRSFTDIAVGQIASPLAVQRVGSDIGATPSEGWLRQHLEELTRRFKPNQFSYT